jgi:hypothetical protein
LPARTGPERSPGARQSDDDRNDFSGEIDTDIIFDYGLFTPRCRWADISDIKKLKMQIDARSVSLSGESLFPNLDASIAKLRVAASAMK